MSVFTPGRTLPCLLSALALLVPIMSARADGQAETKRFDGYIGGGAIAFPRYSGGGSYQVWPVPLMSFEYEETAYIYIQRIGVRLLSNSDKSMAVGIAAEPRFGFTQTDGARLAGMATRRDRIEGGPTFEWETPRASLSIAYFADWSGVSGGGAVNVSLFHPLLDDQHWDLGSFVGVEYVTHKTAQYYYGVRPDEATTMRPAYDPQNAVTSYAGTSGAYRLDQQYAILFGATLTSLSAAAADSPIVERKRGAVVYLGLGSIL